MKATIKKDGNLVIEAETEIEAYALNKWYNDNCDTELGNAAITIDLTLQQTNNIKKDEESNNLF